MNLEELDVFSAYKNAFGSLPDEEMIKVFAGARANGMSERIIKVAIFVTQNDFERGYLKDKRPGKEVARRLRRMYKGGIR